MSQLLMNDYTIPISITLAEKVGVHEAIFLQQLHYWLQETENIHEGHKWVYNTYQEWHEQMSFLTVNQIRRIVRELEKQNLIITGNFNRHKLDKTKWYRINYEAVEQLCKDTNRQNPLFDSCKNETSTQNAEIAKQSHEETVEPTRQSQETISTVQETQLDNTHANNSIVHKTQLDNTHANNSIVHKTQLDNTRDTNSTKQETRLDNIHNTNSTVNETQSDITQEPARRHSHNRTIPKTTTETTPEKLLVAAANAREVNPFTFFEENGFGTIGGYLSEKISAWCEDLSPELVVEAMKQAVEFGCKHWKYVEAILRHWAEKGYQTVNDVHAARLHFEEKMAKRRDKKHEKAHKQGRDIPQFTGLDFSAGEEE